MSEIVDNPDEIKNTTNLEVKSGREITPEDIDALNKFAINSVEIATSSDMKASSKWDSSMADAWVHALANKALGLVRDGSRDANLIMAKDKAGNLVGYSLVILNPNTINPNEKITGVFIGVDESLQGQGIGTQLLKKRVKILQEMGIESYRTNARTRAIGLYDKLHIRYSAEPIKDKPEAKALTVYLK